MASTGLAGRSPALATFGVLASTIIGGGVLALPVALARFGPLGAALVLVAIGLLNLVTVAALASAAVRANAVTTGRGRLATIADEHLGPFSAQAATISSILLWFGVISVFVLGLATTLEDIVGLRASVWAVIYLLIVLALVLGQARQPFITTATAIIIVNLALLGTMIALVAWNARWDLFTAGPLESAGEVDTLQIVFGTVLASYFGHTAVFSVAPDALRADPSGRAVIRGAVAAMLAAMIVNVLWVVAALSAVPAEAYAQDKSTGVGLLNDAVGGAIGPLSTVFVILGMGVVAINAAFILGDTLVERLPRHRRLATVLTPGSWLEAFDALTGTTLTITALAAGDRRIDLVARVRRGRAVAREVIETDSWDARAILHEMVPGRRRRWLRLHVDGDVVTGVMVRAETNLALTEHAAAGSALTNLGGEGLGDRLVTALVRQPATPAELAERLGEPEAHVASTLSDLEEARAVALNGDGTWRPVLGRRHRAKTAIVAALYDELVGVDHEARRASWLETPQAHMLARGLPIALALVLVIVLAETEASFTSMLSLVAMATMVFLAGALPLLLGLSLSQRAERDAARNPLTTTRALLWAFLGLFAAICALYAIVIYRSPIDRLVALAALAVIVTAAYSAHRRGAFKRRSTLALEVDEQSALRVAALEAGRRREVVAPDRLPDGGGEVVITVPDGLASPILLVAQSRDCVPARLGTWRATAGEGRPLAGKQEDPAGEVIELGPGRLEVRWHVR